MKDNDRAVPCSVPCSALLFSPRQERLSELRARLVCKQQQVIQLAQAIDVLTDNDTQDQAAMALAEKILNASIGP